MSFPSNRPVLEEAALIDPEIYDARDPQFAANMGKPDPGLILGRDLEGQDDCRSVSSPTGSSVDSEAGEMPGRIFQDDGTRVPDADAWRREIAERLNKYRARRRPREPRYPSLRLKFEPAVQPESFPRPSEARPHLILDGSAAAAEFVHGPWPAEPVEDEPAASVAPAETGARVIPFPRSASAPPRPLEELAEPLQLFPRILDVPEVTPPPPALGGILIETEEQDSSPKRPGIEIPLQTSPVSRRMLAAAADAVIVAMALGLFGYIFSRVTAIIPPPKQIGVMVAPVLAILWTGYQYLLLTYTGSTPGLWLARLRLSRFDGTAVPRRIRRFRTLVSVLSALSLGLGYAWCILDEDQLCWHDRITRTHLAPKS